MYRSSLQMYDNIEEIKWFKVIRVEISSCPRHGDKVVANVEKQCFESCILLKYLKFNDFTK